MGPAESRFRALVNGQISVAEFLDLALTMLLRTDGRVWVSSAERTWLVNADGWTVVSFTPSLAERLVEVA